MSMALLAKAALALSAAPLASATAPSPFFSMPWLCLERCNDTSSAIAQQVSQFAVNGTQGAGLLTAASMEVFNLGPDSTLLVNNLTHVSPMLQPYTSSRWAMISSYPYPPQFLDWMRQVWANPDPFITACIEAVKEDPSITGFNIDWEPTSSTVLPEDPANYAAFLDYFALKMKAFGIGTSVDVASWSPIWNFTAIGATAVDYVMTMDTYGNSGNFTAWQASVNKAMTEIPVSKLVIGLETVTADGGNYTDAMLQERFAVLQEQGLRQVAFWRAPIPDNWWAFIQQLAAAQ